MIRTPTKPTSGEDSDGSPKEHHGDRTGVNTTSNETLADLDNSVLTNLTANLQLEIGGNSPPQPQRITMVNDAATGATAPIKFKLPAFTKGLPDAWFATVEAMLTAAGINDDLARYNTVIANVDPDVLMEVWDILKVSPDEGKFTHLKSQMISRFADSADQRLRRLFGDLRLDGRKPSELLRHMESLADGKLDQSALKVKWLDLLPHTMQPTLRVLRNSSNDELAKAADELMNLSQPLGTLATSLAAPGAAATPSTNLADVAAAHGAAPNNSLAAELRNLTGLVNQLLAINMQVLAALTNQRHYQQQDRGRSRSRSPSRYNGLCYYHHKFGSAATRCVRPCNFGQTGHGGTSQGNQ